MHRSDRIYLSKFALDPDPEYLDLDDFDFNCEMDSSEFYEKFIPDYETNLSTSARRSPSSENQTLK